MTFSGSMSASNVILPQKHPPSIFIWLHLQHARCRAAGISVFRERYVLEITDPKSRLACKASFLGPALEFLMRSVPSPNSRCKKPERRMSARGQTRKSGDAITTSALPPTADIPESRCDVRKVHQATCVPEFWVSYVLQPSVDQ